MSTLSAFVCFRMCFPMRRCELKHTNSVNRGPIHLHELNVLHCSGGKHGNGPIRKRAKEKVSIPIWTSAFSNSSCLQRSTRIPLLTMSSLSYHWNAVNAISKKFAEWPRSGSVRNGSRHTEPGSRKHSLPTSRVARTGRRGTQVRSVVV